MRALVVFVVLTSVAFAEGPSAQVLYSEGEAEFRAGKIDAAIESFSRGYALEARPEFLLNLGQCYRALGRRSEAIGYFERFIKAAPDHALRSNAERTLEELRRAEALERVALTPTPPATPPPRSKSSRTWLWVTLGATFVAAGAAGIYFATRPASVDDTIRLPP